MGLGAFGGESGSEEAELGWEFYVGGNGDGGGECCYWVKEGIGG